MTRALTVGEIYGALWLAQTLWAHPSKSWGQHVREDIARMPKGLRREFARAIGRSVASEKRSNPKRRR